jgi:putative ABC transport system permease protein
VSTLALQILASAGFAVIAVVAAVRLRLGMAREIGFATIRGAVQLAVVGALITLVFRVPALAFAFVATMSVTAALTSGSRLRPLPAGRLRALAAIALPALGALGLLLAVGAFATTPRAAVPTAGILIGGAMTATTITGRRLLETLREGMDEIEARLCLGDDARTALAIPVRGAVRSGLIPVVDQTRSVGLVTLPGTFVGLVLGGASPTQAAATQFVVLVALVAVELTSGMLISELILRAVIAPGERVLAPVAR